MERIGHEAQKQNVHFTTPPLGLSIYHNSEYKEKDITVEIQSSIAGDYQDTNQVIFYTAPVASVTFSGNYEQMPKVSMAIAKWIEDNQYQLCGPMFSIFHISPMQDSNPDNWAIKKIRRYVKELKK